MRKTFLIAAAYLAMSITTADYCRSAVVICVGDSITEGVEGVDYPSRLATLLGPNFDVINCGSPTSTLLRKSDKPYHLQPEFQEATTTQADIVVIMLGTNDSKPNNWNAASFAADLAWYRQGFGNLRPAPKVFVCTPPTVFQGAWGITQNGVADVCKVIRAKVPPGQLIDVQAAFAKAGGALHYDGVHPNAAGADLIAQTVAAKLLPRKPPAEGARNNALMLQQSSRWAEQIASLHISGSRFSGAFKHDAQAAGWWWYFSTLGAHGLVVDGNYPAMVQDYLERYLTEATLPGYAIDDVESMFTQPPLRRVSDSDDSYGGTIVSLACLYARSSPEGAQWFLAKLEKFKAIINANVVEVIHPELRLPATFNNKPNRLLALGSDKRRYQNVYQLMDACEAYRGLRDLADTLASLGDPDHEKYDSAAKQIALGIKSLFDPKTQSFFGYVEPPLGARHHQDTFYARRFIQASPQAFGVDFGNETQPLYDAAWSFLNANRDPWWNGKADGSEKKDPQMMLAYVAALRGEHQTARSHLTYLENRIQEGRNLVAIDQMGWAARTEDHLRRASKDDKALSK